MAFPKRKPSVIRLPLITDSDYPTPIPQRSLKQKLHLLFFGLLFSSSLLINAFHFMSCYEDSTSQVPFTGLDKVSLTETQILPEAPLRQLQDLILVAGHAIFLGGNLEEVENDDEWVLEDFQKGGEQVKTFLKHIRKGVELAIDNEEGLLIFSGGQTRLYAGARSESQSYWALADSLGMFPTENNSTIFTRATTEEFARDSYENLLFSICRFYE